MELSQGLQRFWLETETLVEFNWVKLRLGKFNREITEVNRVKPRISNKTANREILI